MKRLLLAVAVATVAACSGHGGRASGGEAASSAASAAPAATPAALNVVDFDADSAYAHIAAQVAMGPRVPGSAASAECCAYIASRLRGYGADSVGVQRAVVDNRRGGTMAVANVLARYNASAGRRILLLAHYDTRPWADSDPDEANRARPVPGANDGASGVAVLLELARLVGEQAPAVGVDLLFVDGEDSGSEGDDESWCLGTQAWLATAPYRGLTPPAYAVLLDMVGGHGAVFRREMLSDHYARAVNDRIWAVAAASGFADRFANARGGAVTDDHIFLNRAGIAAVDIIDAANPATGSFPPTWHTIADDLPAISTATLKAVGQTVANLIYSEKVE